MSHPAFVLVNGNLTYDPVQPNLCTDDPHICYGAKVPVPAPAGRGGGGGGGGPGWPLIRFDCLPCRPKSRDLSEFAKAIARKIRDEISRESSKFSPADPLGVIQRISPEKIRERDLRVLRSRIRELETEVERLRTDQAAEAEALARTVEELRKVVSDLEKKVESLKEANRVGIKTREVYRLGLAESGSPVVVKTNVVDEKSVEEILVARISSAMAEYVTEPRRLVQLATDPVKGGLWKLVAAVGIYAATDSFVPKDIQWLRTLGYGAAVTLAVGGVAELLRVKTKGGKQ